MDESFNEMNNMKIQILITTMVFVLSGCVTRSNHTRVKCDDGEIVFVLRDVAKAYPVYAEQFDVQLKASVDSINKILADAAIDAGARNRVIKLRQDLDQERSAIQEQLKTAVIQLQTAPCDKENRRAMAKLQTRINDRIADLATLTALGELSRKTQTESGSTSAEALRTTQLRKELADLFQKILDLTNEYVELKQLYVTSASPQIKNRIEQLKAKLDLFKEDFVVLEGKLALVEGRKPRAIKIDFIIPLAPAYLRVVPL